MNFKFRHLVYPVRKDCTVVIEPVFPVAVDAARNYELLIRPFSGLRRYGLRGCEGAPTEADEAFFAEKHALTVKDGCLEIRAAFPQEDCYLCKLSVDGVQTDALEIYALNDDLFGKTPYKGDNHMHTWMSDGKDSPMFMAAAACRHGYDYCVITDHHKYEPSLIARDFYKDTGVDFLVIPGEEIHSPDNPVHIINLGGNASVNAWWREDDAEYRAAVDAELETMDVPMVKADKYAAAASQVVFDRIHSVDGVAILCHPNWILPNGFNEAEDITDYLFDNKRFDVLELIAGGAYEVGTQMQISYYHDRETMPIVGSSDSHACFGEKLEPGNFTIVFADGLDTESVKAAIRAGRTVAGNENKLYGDYRLVKYAYFLMRNFYPDHKLQRNQLGARMIRFASSRDEATDGIREALKTPRPSEIFEPLRWKAE
ncbi:MAG: hypothetical protein IJO98_07340 [Clostridia bacterium]|nr:hypothetical protein [Clostridia bacterium]